MFKTTWVFLCQRSLAAMTWVRRPSAFRRSFHISSSTPCRRSGGRCRRPSKTFQAMAPRVENVASRMWSCFFDVFGGLFSLKKNKCYCIFVKHLYFTGFGMDYVLISLIYFLPLFATGVFFPCPKPSFVWMKNRGDAMRDAYQRDPDAFEEADEALFDERLEALLRRLGTVPERKLAGSPRSCPKAWGVCSWGSIAGRECFRKP